jgi:hypothetical protein
MTQEEVEALLGRPCDWDLSDPGNNPTFPCWIWLAGTDLVEVHVSHNERVTAADWFPARGMRPILLP